MFPAARRHQGMFPGDFAIGDNLERCWDVLLTNYAVSGTTKFPAGALAAPAGPPGAHRGGRQIDQSKEP